jgi:hypothetical protein
MARSDETRWGLIATVLIWLAVLTNLRLDFIKPGFSVRLYVQPWKSNYLYFAVKDCRPDWGVSSDFCCGSEIESEGGYQRTECGRNS